MKKEGDVGETDREIRFNTSCTMARMLRIFLDAIDGNRLNDFKRVNEELKIDQHASGWPQG